MSRIACEQFGWLYIGEIDTGISNYPPAEDYEEGYAEGTPTQTLRPETLAERESGIAAPFVSDPYSENTSNWQYPIRVQEPGRSSRPPLQPHLFQQMLHRHYQQSQYRRRQLQQQQGQPQQIQQQEVQSPEVQQQQFQPESFHHQQFQPQSFHQSQFQPQSIQQQQFQPRSIQQQQFQPQSIQQQQSHEQSVFDQMLQSSYEPRSAYERLQQRHQQQQLREQQIQQIHLLQRSPASFMDPNGMGFENYNQWVHTANPWTIYTAPPAGTDFEGGGPQQWDGQPGGHMANDQQGHRGGNFHQG
ncbi:MAG: hypothetical protein Q9162_000525 [Coniocarpon cinnabarinum]